MRPPEPLEPLTSPIKLEPELAKQDGPIMEVEYEEPRYFNYPVRPYEPDRTYCGSRLQIPVRFKIGKKAA
jgi:hypothetical protein